jgi:hypothetical protein
LALGAALPAVDCDPAGGAPAGSPCETVYRGQCGTLCGDDEGCPGGLFCNGSFCTANCSAGAACDGGRACSPRGRCVDDAAGDGAEAGGAGRGGAGACEPVAVTIARVVPRVVLLVDQSGSMKCPLGLAEPCDAPDEVEPGAAGYEATRWSQLRALLAAPDGPVARLDDRVAFGAALYTYEGDGTDDVPGSCPELTPRPEALALATGGYERVKAVLAGHEPRGATPTGEAVRVVAGALAAAGGPKYLILATDGDPDTCRDPDANGQPGPKDLALAEVRAARGAGVTTYVVGISKFGADRDHLQALALAGQGLADGTAERKYYEVGGRDELVAAFDAILDGVRSCAFDLGAAVAPGGVVARARFTVGGAEARAGDPDGWRTVDADTVEFVGAACAAVERGAEVRATLPCDAAVAPGPG